MPTDRELLVESTRQLVAVLKERDALKDQLAAYAFAEPAVAGDELAALLEEVRGLLLSANYGCAHWSGEFSRKLDSAAERCAQAEAALRHRPAAPAADAVVEAWQPIETAPRDAAVVDLWHRTQHRRYADCCWKWVPANGRPYWFSRVGGREWNVGTDEYFSHWKALPEPPRALSPETTEASGEG